MAIQEITEYLDKKINKDENILKITFSEARIKLNLSEDEPQEFLKLCKTRLENLVSQVFFTGSRYMYQG